MIMEQSSDAQFHIQLSSLHSLDDNMDIIDWIVIREDILWSNGAIPQCNTFLRKTFYWEQLLKWGIIIWIACDNEDMNECANH